MTAFPTIVLASGNAGKVDEFQAFFAEFGLNLALKPPDLEIEETGETFAENARLKASGVAAATGQWALADDSGLEVMALDRRPGVYSARYGRSDAERIARVLHELGDRPDRQAQFVCAIAVAAPDGGVVAEALGICTGEILHAPRGDRGFGYDPIFYVPELGQTFGELSAAEKHRLSHRARAMALLRPQIQAIDFGS